MITYDYEAVASEEIVDVSCYRALMDLDGICQSFAAAYAYLCLQCGIDAVTVSGMNEANDTAHEWVLLTLGGKYYYADPTFENGDGGTGLKYFGMTAMQRYNCGYFLPDICNIGGTNVIWGRDIDVTDERYRELWQAVNVLNMAYENGLMKIICEKTDGTEFEFVLE